MLAQYQQLCYLGGASPLPPGLIHFISVFSEGDRPIGRLGKRQDVLALFCPIQAGFFLPKLSILCSLRESLGGSLRISRAVESPPALFLAPSLGFLVHLPPKIPCGPVLSPFSNHLTQPLLLWDNNDTHTEHSVGTRPCPKYFTGINSLYLQTTLWDEHSLFYEGGNGGSERLSDLPKVTEPGKWRGSEVAWLNCAALLPHGVYY